MPNVKASRAPFLLLATSILVALVLVEGALHVLDLPPRETGDPRQFVEYDSILGWRNIPNATGVRETDEYKVVLHYNSHGLRGPERPYAKRPGAYRIVVLGDSFVEGYSVDAESLVTQVLESLLAARSPGCTVEVISMGTAGYSTDQELLWLESEGLTYGPDLVVLMFSTNDIWYNAQPAYWRGSKPVFVLRGGRLELENVPVPKTYLDSADRDDASPSARTASGLRAWLRANSHLYRLARAAMDNTPGLRNLAIRLGLAEPRPGIDDTTDDDLALPDEFLVFSPDKPPEVARAWEVTDALLARMKERVQQSGAGLVLFYIPPLWTVYRQESAVRPGFGLSADELDEEGFVRRFLDACRRASIACINPAARFLTAADSLGREETRLYFEVDRHWTPRGHRLAAEILAEHARARSPELRRSCS